jgi:hypothetical protein
MWNADFARYDGRVKSFLFTLKNPHGIPPRKFELKGEQTLLAISLFSVITTCTRIALALASFTSMTPG